MNQPETGHALSSAYLVSPGGNSKEMDDSFEQALARHGLKVAADKAEPTDPKAYDVVVKYDDSWRWDLAMYLLSLDVELYDGKDGALMAHSTWHNSPAHGFQKANDVVPQLLDETFAKLAVKQDQANDVTPAPAAATGR